MKTKRKKLILNIASLLLVFLLMAAAAIVRDGRFLGQSLTATDDETAPSAKIVENPDGSFTINTEGVDVGLTGYAGPVPVEITVKDGKILQVRALDNVETPAFFKKVQESGLLSVWDGMTAEDALNEQVDAVTGATFSSKSLIANVQAGLKEYADSDIAAASAESSHGPVFYLALMVLLMGAIIPIFVKDKRYRLLQEILNVGVLGFWAGTFVDYTLMLGVMSNGLGASASLVTLLMLFVAFIYPLFNLPGHYCAWVCPLGSLQELASRCNPNHKIKIPARVSKALTRFRMILWMALMLCLWTGFFAGWIDYELFTAFIVESASIGVLIAGGLFVLLSFFVTRPYCRFVCPTGTILRMSQDMENK